MKRGFSASITVLIASVLLTGCAAATTTIDNPNFEDDSAIEESSPRPSAEASNSPSPQATAEPTPEKPQQKDLSVVETYFWPDEDYDRWYFVAYIENDNDDYAWIFEGFDFEAYDSEGVLLDSNTEYATILPNSTEVFYGYWFDIGNNIVTNMEVFGPTNGTLLDSETGNFEVESIEFSNGRYSSDVSGVIASNFSEDQESVEVVVVIRDNDGRIITAENSYVSRVPAGGKSRYEVTLFDFEVTDDMKIEVYPKL